MVDCTRGRVFGLGGILAALLMAALLAAPVLTRGQQPDAPAQVESGPAQGLVLDNLVVDNRQGDILVRFGVAVENLPQIRQILMDGQSLELVCDASLVQVRTLWGNKLIAKAQTRFGLRYDPLAGVFAATALDDGQGNGMVDADLPALLDRMWGAVVMDLGAWDNLKRSKRYSLRLAIAMTRTDVPPWLRRALFFWGWDAAPTANYQLDFSY